MAAPVNKIADIQRRLDEKLIDPAQLKPEQIEALNDAFQDGTLKGYKSVAEMKAERATARADIAADVRQRLEPLTGVPLIGQALKRQTLTAVGDIVGSFTPYILDSNKLAVEAREAALAGKSVSYLPELRKESGQKSIQYFANLLSNLPGFRSIGLFKKTAGMLDGTLDAARAFGTGKLAFSQLGKTELKSQLLGATSAAGASVAYDVVNTPLKYVTAHNEDIAKYDKNELNALPFTERVTYHAADAFKTALAWNAGALGLTSLAKGVFQGARSWFRVSPDNLQKTNQLIDNQGLSVSPILLAEGTGGPSGIFKNMNRILSVLPAGAGEPLKFQQKFTGQALLGLLGNIKGGLNNAPLLHAEVLANPLNVSIRNAFQESQTLIKQLYDGHEGSMNVASNVLQKYVNEALSANRAKAGTVARVGDDSTRLNAMFPNGMDLPFIATYNLRKTSEDILGAISKGVTPGQAQRRAYKGLADASNDITVRYVSEILDTLNDYRKINGGDYLTPSQFNSLRQGWNKNYPNTNINNIGQQSNIFRILESFEKDFNFVNHAPNNAFLFERNAKLGNAYNTLKNELGEARANDFLNDFKKAVADSNDELREANYVFGQMTNFYHFNRLAKEARNMDPAMLTAKQGLDFFLPGKVTDVQGMDRLFKTALDPQRGTSQGVDELYKLMGGSTRLPKETQDQARYVMKLLTYRKIFDAFNKNVVVRLSGVQGAAREVTAQPFTEQGIESIQEAIQVLNAKSPEYKKTVQQLIEKDFKLGQGNVKIPQDELSKYERRAITPDVIQKAIKNEIPITQDIFITREKQLGKVETGKVGFLRGYYPTGQQPIKPVTEDIVKLTERAKLGQVTEGGVTRDVTREERAAAQNELETLSYRMQGYQGFKFEQFEKDLGLNSKAGEEQLIKLFEISNGVTNQEAKKHIENIKTIITGMRKNYAETPVGDANTYILRSLIFAAGTGAGGLLGFFGGGSKESAAGGAVLGAVLPFLAIKGAAHLFNSPKAAKKWTDLYSTGERLDINLKNLNPPKRAIFADLFNYLFDDDPSAPKVNPKNIDEEAVIKYLQSKNKLTVPTDRGIYNAIPEQIKDRFKPERVKLKELKGESKDDLNYYFKGKQVAKFRDELLDNLDTQMGAKVAAQPRVSEFIRNPMDLRIPEGAKNIQPQPVYNQVTADVYQGLFPQDTLGQVIAQKQATPTPPMMKKGGLVNVKN